MTLRLDIYCIIQGIERQEVIVPPKVLLAERKSIRLNTMKEVLHKDTRTRLLRVRFLGQT